MSGFKLKVLTPKQWDHIYQCDHKASEYMNENSLCYLKDYFSLKFDNPPKVLPTPLEYTLGFIKNDPNFIIIQPSIVDFLNTKLQSNFFSNDDSQKEFFEKTIELVFKNKNIVSKDLFFYLLEIFKNAEYETITDEELGIKI